MAISDAGRNPGRSGLRRGFFSFYHFNARFGVRMTLSLNAPLAILVGPPFPFRCSFLLLGKKEASDQTTLCNATCTRGGEGEESSTTSFFLIVSPGYGMERVCPCPSHKRFSCNLLRGRCCWFWVGIVPPASGRETKESFSPFGGSNHLCSLSFFKKNPGKILSTNTGGVML